MPDQLNAAMLSSRELLERYVEAKDLTRPQLAPSIYWPDAVLTYTIATDTIEFPARSVGVEAIAQTLISDFAVTFRDCRTYYVCDAPPAEATSVAVVPWLVVMREVGGALRIGRGLYRWTFRVDGGQRKVAAMHIHIDRMDRVEDAAGAIRRAVQSALPYPWLAPATLQREVEQLARQRPERGFLCDFATPVRADVLANLAPDLGGARRLTH